MNRIETRKAQSERDVGRMFNHRCRRIIPETRLRTGKAPMPRMGRPTPWNITPRDNGLSRMELAAYSRQRTTSPDLLMHLIPQLQVPN